MLHRLTQRAEDDLPDIYRYTTDTFGTQQADKYERELDGVFRLIAEFSNVGRRYQGESHQFVHGKHIIIYRRTAAGVTIGRIFHGAQSPPLG